MPGAAHGSHIVQRIMRCCMSHSKRDSRRVLVIDRNSVKLNLRATILRNYEVEVHTASSLEAAGDLWSTNFYDLIMVEARENPQAAETVSDQIRRLNPRQRVALLVGAPSYVREVALVPAKVVEKAQDRPTGPSPTFPSQWEQTVQLLLTMVNAPEQVV
jgi:response regulator RpfG family c-di-GMP phosphodiesterase